MTMTLEPESPSVAAEAPGKGLRWVVVLLVLVLGVAAGVEIHLRRKEARVDALLDEIDHELERLIETDPDGAANAVDELSPKFNAVMGLIAELEAMLGRCAERWYGAAIFTSPCYLFLTRSLCPFHPLPPHSTAHRHRHQRAASAQQQQQQQQQQ